MSMRKSTKFEDIVESEKRRAQNLMLRNEKCKEAMYMFRNLLPAGATVKVDPFDTVDHSKSFREFVRLACDFTKPKQQLKAVRSVATWLADIYDSDLNKCIEKDLIPAYKKMLWMTKNRDLQYEAALSLTFLSRSYPERSNLVVKGGAIEPLIQHLGSADDRVAQTCVRALANILFYGLRLPDLNIVTHFGDPLVSYLKPDLPVTHLIYILHVMTALSNPTPPSRLPAKLISAVLPHLKYLLKHFDTKVLISTTWIVANFAQPKTGRKDMIIASKILRSVVPLIKHSLAEVQEPALLVFTYIAMGSIEQKQKVVSSGALKNFPTLFPTVRYTALYCLLHITSGTQANAKAVVDAGLVPHIVDALRTGTPQMKKFAAGIVSQLAATDDTQRVFTMLDAGVIEPFCNFLQSDDADVVTDILEGLLSILRAADTRCAEVVRLIQICGGWQQIIGLEGFGNSEIQKLICHLEVIYSTGEDLANMASDEGYIPFNTKAINMKSCN